MTASGSGLLVKVLRHDSAAAVRLDSPLSNPMDALIQDVLIAVARQLPYEPSIRARVPSAERNHAAARAGAERHAEEQYRADRGLDYEIGPTIADIVTLPLSCTTAVIAPAPFGERRCRQKSGQRWLVSLSSLAFKQLLLAGTLGLQFVPRQRRISSTLSCALRTTVGW